jgi:hypothetical protein
MGAEILRRQIQNPEFILDVSAFQSGLYLVQIIIINGQTISSKLIIER